MVRLIEGLPGLTVRCTAGGCDVAMMRASTYVQRGREGCGPAIYLDGRKTPFSASDVDLMLQARDIAAIEVYPRTSGRPIEFAEPFNNCGAIVVWTKPSLR